MKTKQSYVMTFLGSFIFLVKTFSRQVRVDFFSFLIQILDIIYDGVAEPMQCKDSFHLLE